MKSGVDDVDAHHCPAGNGTGNARFGTVQLGSFGDSVSWEIATFNGEHMIGRPMCRATNVLFNV